MPVVKSPRPRAQQLPSYLTSLLQGWVLRCTWNRGLEPVESWRRCWGPPTESEWPFSHYFGFWICALCGLHLMQYSLCSWHGLLFFSDASFPLYTCLLIHFALWQIVQWSVRVLTGLIWARFHCVRKDFSHFHLRVKINSYRDSVSHNSDFLTSYCTVSLSFTVTALFLTAVWFKRQYLVILLI